METNGLIRSFFLNQETLINLLLYRLTNETSTISMFKEYTNLLEEFLTLEDPSDPMNYTLLAGEYIYPFQYRLDNIDFISLTTFILVSHQQIFPPLLKVHLVL
jgi:hypothetical protein